MQSLPRKIRILLDIIFFVARMAHPYTRRYQRLYLERNCPVSMNFAENKRAHYAAFRP